MSKYLNLNELLSRRKYIKLGDVLLPNKVAFEKVSQSIRPFGSVGKMPPEYSEYIRKSYILDGRTFAVEEEFPTVFSRYGSATLLTYEGYYFCIFTRHQLKHLFGELWTPDIQGRILISMDYDGGTSGVAIKKILMASKESGDDLNDIVVAVLFDCFYAPEQRARFFPIKLYRKFPIGTNVIAAGYRYDQDFDTNEYALSVYNITCVTGIIIKYHDNQKDMLCTLCYENEIVNFDGMSGGAVYAIEADAEQFYVSFAGMIVRGGNGYCYFITNERIFGIINDFVDGKSVYGDIT